MTAGRGTRFNLARDALSESIIGRPHVSGRHEYYEKIFSCKPAHELTRWCMNAPAHDGVRHRSLTNDGARSLRFDNLVAGFVMASSLPQGAAPTALQGSSIHARNYPCFVPSNTPSPRVGRPTRYQCYASLRRPARSIALAEFHNLALYLQAQIDARSLGLETCCRVSQ